MHFFGSLNWFDNLPGHWVNLDLPCHRKNGSLFGDIRDLEKAVEQLSQMLNEPIEDVEIKDFRQRIMNKMVSLLLAYFYPICAPQPLVFYYPLIAPHTCAHFLPRYDFESEYNFDHHL